MQTKTTLIAILVLLVVVIGGVVILNKATSKPSKYEGLATALNDKGVKFYGAFWCPHCADQEKDFGMSRQALEKIGLYHECSTPDGQGELQTCKDVGVEAFPTWVFPEPIVLTGTPTICPIQSELTSDSPSVCKNASSPAYKTWLFPGDATSPGGISVASKTAPVTKDTTWTFDAATSHITGGLTMAFLAKQIGFTLPQ
jgi:hypothetical protein